MTVTINGTTGITLPSGVGEAVGTTGTQSVTNKTIGSGTVVGVSLLTSDVVKNATGTSVDFTGIPSWVKRITVMFSGVSTNGSSPLRFQLGSGGGITNTGYSACCSQIQSGVVGAAATAGFDAVSAEGGASGLRNGQLVFCLLGSNVWTMCGQYNLAGINVQYIFSGSVGLPGVLDRIRITTVGGTDTFDNGSINILYE